MLTSLSIKNYALIDQIEVNFQEGLSTITGETGAGKSILLGALSLVLGERADASLVGDKTKKCIVEANFVIDKYDLKSFFEGKDLDYEKLTTLRREILPNGKSRAFINDTPTTLSVLNELSEQLIDIHSQHETLQLADKNYQFQIIDALAANKIHLSQYGAELNLYKTLLDELHKIEIDQQKSKEEFDYNTFVLKELEDSKLQIGELENLEEKLEKLTHSEEIKLQLIQAREIAEDEQFGLKNLMYTFKNSIDKISGFSNTYNQLAERINSLFIDFNDIADEIENESENISYDAYEIEKLNNRLQLIYDLQKKYKLSSIEELLELQLKMSEKVENIVNASQIIATKKAAIDKVSEKLNSLSNKIHKKRQNAISKFTQQLKELLVNLKMKNTVLDIKLIPVDTYNHNGKDDLNFLISADNGAHFESIKKAASGGEMSRIMLAIKSILSNYTKLPTIIFDEIDTGVSGEVSNKIADVMQFMSHNMQVIAITHLPQIAAKGNQHYKVFKKEENAKIKSDIKLLNSEERILEIAGMLSGKNVTKTAVEHAKQLLN
ncbi:MAG: DNA repair protein RecN [Bacteroidota bacterium]